MDVCPSHAFFFCGASKKLPSLIRYEDLCKGLSRVLLFSCVGVCACSVCVLLLSLNHQQIQRPRCDSTGYGMGEQSKARVRDGAWTAASRFRSSWMCELHRGFCCTKISTTVIGGITQNSKNNPNQVYLSDDVKASRMPQGNIFQGTAGFSQGGNSECRGGAHCIESNFEATFRVVP